MKGRAAPKSSKKTPPVKKGPAKSAPTPPADDSTDVKESVTPIACDEKKPEESSHGAAAIDAGTRDVKQEVEEVEIKVGDVNEAVEVKTEPQDELVVEETIAEGDAGGEHDGVDGGGEMECVPEVPEETEANLGEMEVHGDVEAEGGEEEYEVIEEPVHEKVEGEGEDEVAEGEEGVGVEVEEQVEISDMIKLRKIKKEREIFVGGLDRDATEEDVKKAFETIGEVIEVRVHRDPATNKNKGFAFVMFASKELADKALAEMKNPVIRGKRCGIAASEDNDTLFLGNVCNTWTKEAIKRKLKDYGVEGLENITLVEDTRNEGLSRGFAFLEFSCHADAMLAYKRLQKNDVVFGHPDRTAKVAFAEPLREPDAEVMAQVKSVFVDGMPPYWDEDRVKEQFKGFGDIERVVLARNMPTARRMDFGFVNFSTHEAALACVEGLNNTELGDGKSKMKVRARLANPLPKTQAVKGGMRGGFRIGHSVGGFSRFGRGLGRGRFPRNRGGFPSGRGFYPRGRGGRFPISGNAQDFPFSHFRGRRPFGRRGGRRGSLAFAYEGQVDEFGHYPSRGGTFRGSRGRPFQARRPNFPSDAEFGGYFDGGEFGEDSRFYGDTGHGFKRPYSMMEHDSGYMDSGRRLYPRYDFAEASSARYRDTNLGAGGTYSAGGPYSEYYNSNFGERGYPSFYGNDQSGGGQYF